MRNLYFFEVIDPDRIVMTFASEKDFNKVGQYAKLAQLARSIFDVSRQDFVGLIRQLPSGDIEFSPCAFGHRRERKMIQAAAHVSSRITVLQTPGEYLIQSGSRNNSKLAEPRYRQGKLPAR